MNDWRFDRSVVAVKGEMADSSNARKPGPRHAFLSTLTKKEAAKFALFETKFKKFLYGGVAVQVLLPHAAPTRGDMTRREKRTLWLMLPEVGSLRLGFVSKARGGLGEVLAPTDDITVASSVASSRAEADVSADARRRRHRGGSLSRRCPSPRPACSLPRCPFSAPSPRQDFTARTDVGNVRLSRKYSVPLTDITTLSQDPNVSVKGWCHFSAEFLEGRHTPKGQKKRRRACPHEVRAWCKLRVRTGSESFAFRRLIIQTWLK